jgi:hypothetical protein
MIELYTTIPTTIHNSVDQTLLTLPRELELGKGM